MRTVTQVVFDREDLHAFKLLSQIIGIAYPTMSDAALAGGRGMPGVPDDDPHRRVLIGFLRSRNDPISRTRLMLALETLEVLRERIEIEANPAHWAGTSEAQIAVMVEARAHQLGESDEAIGVVRRALELVGPAPEESDA